MPDQDVILNTRIQQKKDTDANWASNNPILLKNELIVVEMDSGECRFKIGDGTSSYTELPFITSGFSSVLGIDQGGTGASTTSDAASNLKVASLQPGAILPSGTDIKNVVEPNTYLLLKNFTYKSVPSDLDRSTNEILLTSKIQDTLIQHVLIAPDTVYLAFWSIPLSRAGEIESDPIPWIDLRDAKTAEALALSCTIQTDLASTSVARFNGRSNITPGITGTLGVAHGGTGATTVKDARYTLGVPAELGVVPTDGFPFGYGAVVARGGLGNTIGQFIGDNYYWGVDSDAKLWGGSQVNGATSITWNRAMMMDGSQSFVNIFTGVLTSGSVTVNDNGPKCAAWMIGAIPDPATEAMVVQCVPGGIYEGRIYSGDRWIHFRIESQNKTITIKSSSHGGSIEVIWGLLKYTL